MKLFKNFQTKRQLRAENEKLWRTLSVAPHRPIISIVEREVQEISSCMEITDIADKIPIEMIKIKIAHNLAKELEPFIEWDIEDNSDENRYGKVVRGNIYLAKRK